MIENSGRGTYLQMAGMGVAGFVGGAAGAYFRPRLWGIPAYVGCSWLSAALVKKDPPGKPSFQASVIRFAVGAYLLSSSVRGAKNGLHSAFRALKVGHFDPLERSLIGTIWSIGTLGLRGSQVTRAAWGEVRHEGWARARHASFGMGFETMAEFCDGPHAKGLVLDNRVTSAIRSGIMSSNPNSDQKYRTWFSKILAYFWGELTEEEQGKVIAQVVDGSLRISSDALQGALQEQGHQIEFPVEKAEEGEDGLYEAYGALFKEFQGHKAVNALRRALGKGRLLKNEIVDARLEILGLTSEEEVKQLLLKDLPTLQGISDEDISARLVDVKETQFSNKSLQDRIENKKVDNILDEPALRQEVAIAIREERKWALIIQRIETLSKNKPVPEEWVEWEGPLSEIFPQLYHRPQPLEVKLIRIALWGPSLALALLYYTRQISRHYEAFGLGAVFALAGGNTRSQQMGLWKGAILEQTGSWMEASADRFTPAWGALTNGVTVLEWVVSASVCRKVGPVAMGCAGFLWAKGLESHLKGTKPSEMDQVPLLWRYATDGFWGIIPW